MKCPKCGSEGYDEDWREVTIDDGFDGKWYEERWLVCADCGHEEKVGLFCGHSEKVKQ